MDNCSKVHNTRYKRLEEALAVIEECKTETGFYASGDLYKHEYWTRDFSYSLEGLLEAGHAETARKNLESLWDRQKLNGKLPVLFIKNKLPWMYNSLKKGRLKSFLGSFSGLVGIINSIFGVSDPTPHAVLATYDYARITGDYSVIKAFAPRIKKAIDYIERQYDDRMLVGCDWRDLMPEMKKKKLLSNQCLLYRIYCLSGLKEKAEILKQRINENFWNGEFYISALDSADFDVLGTSLAVRWGIIPKERYLKTALMLRRASGQYGIKNMILSSENYKIGKVRIAKCDQYGTIWPFVSYNAVVALHEMGCKEEALEEFNKLDNLPGFNEWYEPHSGRPCGSRDQLWSAAMYITATKKLKTNSIPAYNIIDR